MIKILTSMRLQEIIKKARDEGERIGFQKCINSVQFRTRVTEELTKAEEEIQKLQTKAYAQMDIIDAYKSKTR